MNRRLNNPPPVARLHGLLADAGIPVNTVRRTPTGFEVELAPDATPAHRTQAAEIVNIFDADAIAPDVAAFNQLVLDMSVTGFNALTGVQKLERMRAALEWLLKQ